MKTKNDIPINISNNCWGYLYYHKKNIPYPTPFIGLFMFGPDYIQMLENLEDHMNAKLNFVKKSKYELKHKYYPLGKLLDAEIHFLHYTSEEKARNKWNRRKSKMHNNMDRYYFKFDDVEKPSEYSHMQRFHSLSFKNKVSFSTASYPEFQNNIEFYFGKSLSDGRLYKTTPFCFYCKQMVKTWNNV